MLRLKELLQVQGRITRLRYWQWQLFLVLAGAILMIVGSGAVMFAGPAGGIFFLPGVFLIIGSFAVAIRRLHDRNKSGWWIMPYFILPWMGSAWASEVDPNMTGFATPVVVLAALGLQLWGLVEVGFRRGTPGANRFGPDPQAPDAGVFA